MREDGLAQEEVVVWRHGDVDGRVARQGRWWSGASSHTLMAAEIDGMALWRLGVRCAKMGSRRRRLLSGVMVTSMAEWPDKVEASI